jgi:hypothetical protein
MYRLFARPSRWLAASLVLFVPALALPAQAQSDASRASQKLSAASIALPAASVDLLAAGGAFSVVALRPVGASVEMVLASAADGARISLRVGGEALAASGVVIGTALVATAVSGGYLLWAGSEAVAFVADATLAPLIHRQELRP